MGSKHAYGKTALGKGVTLTGVDEYLKKVEALGKNIFEVTKEAIDESVKPIVEDMKARAYPHKDNGDVYNAIEAKPAKQEGNTVSAFVGIDLQAHPEATHALYEEYGGNNNTSFPDPFIRPAFDLNVRKVKAIQKEVLKKAGVPTDG